MNRYNYMLLTLISIGVSICSCDKNQPRHIRTADSTTKTVEAAYDTMLKRIAGQKKNFSIDPRKKNNLVSKKGIKLAIPENAFVNADGTIPAGNVSVTVSEYHNPADILVSGINMQYNTSGGPIQMESAGMFNMEASSGGKTLQLAQGKKIDVEVPSKNKDADFNLYYFDAVENAWKEKQKILPVKNADLENGRAGVLKTGKEIDTELTIEWNTAKPVLRKINGQLISLVKPDCLYDDVCFAIPLVTNKHPELGLYKEILWTGYVTQDKMKVTAAFQMDQLVSAEIIERVTPLNKYLMSLQFRNLKITAYMKIVSRPEQCAVNEEIYTAYVNERPVDEVRIEKIENRQKVSKKTEEIYRTFSITQMGLWNCDRLYVMTKKSIIHPRFRNASTNTFYTTGTLFLIDKNINSVWTYTSDIILNPDSDNLIIFVSDKGKICYARMNRLSDTRSEPEINLTIDVSEIADKPNNTEDLYLLIRKKM